MKAKLKISVHLHMGNYVNQVHHTTNTGESREVKSTVGNVKIALSEKIALLLHRQVDVPCSLVVS